MNEPGDLFAPFKLGPITLRNRFIRAGAEEAATLSFDIVIDLATHLGVDLLEPRKPDRFRRVGRGGSVRIDRERVACAA